MSEINVVPYIDVMLVLLVIFMITAPLLTQGVKVNLPQASAKPMQGHERKPLILTIDKQGLFYLDAGEDPLSPVGPNTLVARIAAVLIHKKGTPVLIRGDEGVPYGRVMDAMVLAQKAGAPSVGLITKNPER